MNVYIFDYEVFAHDWLFVAKSVDTGEYTVIHNDSDLIKVFMTVNEPVLCGFNNKHYDQYIHKAILLGAAPEQVKEINDFIILQGRNGWEYPLFSEDKISFKQFDLMDDCQQGLSLKAIEAHLGMDIRESTVDFDIDRPLTKQELDEVIFYCKHDVDATEELFKLRKDYLNTKVWLGRSKGMTDEDALYMTNAKLTAAFLDATATPHDDERDYKYPDNLLRQYIPDEVFKFFDRLHDTAFTDDEIFHGEKLEFNIGDCECKIGWGGIHGAIPTYREKATDKRTIRNLDVASYYPHLLTIDGYISRNIPDPSVYANMLEERMKAKKSGDKKKANALKLVANTTYGGMLNRWNPLYDARNARSVCITGQLRLLELANHLVSECKTLKIIQLNTDGIMVSLDTEDVPKYEEIYREWMTRTGYELEEDSIREIVQKDVNNYVEIATDGEHKIKGGVLVRGIAPAGAFNVNNNMTIVSDAIVNYFTKGIAIEDTVNACTDILAFQIVAKASSKYSAAYHIVNGEKVKVQKCNRVYATADPRYGALVKTYRETGTDELISNLPEHCFIDNNNELTIDKIDERYYIDLAKRYIGEFLGVSPNLETQNKLPIEGDKPMATTKTAPKAEKPAPAEKTPAPVPILRRIAEIRQEWELLQHTKSGVNHHSEFTYFELEDIVPAATKLCRDHNTMFVVNFPDETVTGTLYCLDSDECFKFVTRKESIKDPAKFRMNEIQASGAAMTYYRRYMWGLLLDILDPDKIDSDTSAPVSPVEVPKTPVVPPKQNDTPVVVNAPKKEADAPEEEADVLQKKALRNVMQEVLNLEPKAEDSINKILSETNNFANLSAARCEELLAAFNTTLKALKNV